MQKKLILAASVAGVLAAPGAFAAATVYGHMDIGLQRVDPGGGYSGADWHLADQQGSGGSLLGFRANDDIGGGLKGLAVIEVGFFTDTGIFDNTVSSADTIKLAQRQVFAGLQGGFGTLTAGRQYREIFLVGNGGAYNYTAAGIGVFFLNSNTSVRQDNLIKYVSPNLGGANIVVSYAPGEGTDADGSTQDNDKYTEFGLRWAAGPLRLGVAVATSTADAAATPAVDTDHTVVGGQYAFGPTTVYALYSSSENDSAAAPSNRTAISFGVKQTIGMGDVVVQVGQSEDDRTGASDADSMLIGVAYYHRLSKQTTVYTAYGTVDNDSNARLNAPRQIVGTTAAGEDPNTLSFGIRRFF